jgi:hypothetical protein
MLGPDSHGRHRAGTRSGLPRPHLSRSMQIPVLHRIGRPHPPSSPAGLVSSGTLLQGSIVGHRGPYHQLQMVEGGGHVRAHVPSHAAVGAGGGMEGTPLGTPVYLVSAAPDGSFQGGHVVPSPVQATWEDVAAISTRSTPSSWGPTGPGASSRGPANAYSGAAGLTRRGDEAEAGGGRRGAERETTRSSIMYETLSTHPQGPGSGTRALAGGGNEFVRSGARRGSLPGAEGVAVGVSATSPAHNAGASTGAETDNPELSSARSPAARGPEVVGKGGRRRSRRHSRRSRVGSELAAASMVPRSGGGTEGSAPPHEDTPHRASAASLHAAAAAPVRGGSARVLAAASSGSGSDKEMTKPSRRSSKTDIPDGGAKSVVPVEADGGVEGNILHSAQPVQLQ